MLQRKDVYSFETIFNMFLFAWIFGIAALVLSDKLLGDSFYGALFGLSLMISVSLHLEGEYKGSKSWLNRFRARLANVIAPNKSEGE